ncbi:MAG: hypothetical protein M1839_005652 [Geoglossum umbratile]|nr:MAG: hypothetical protein M1839_005652 [Geoglossum umbratile]
MKPPEDRAAPDGDDDNDDRNGGQKEKKEKKKEGKQPRGGFSDTPIPAAEPGYTLRITFIRATNLPMADLSSLSSDPFVRAEFKTSLPMRHKEDPILSFRTPTIRRNVNPEWNAAWVIANVPSSGFRMKARILDEDQVDHDDRLGSVHVYVDHVDESWEGICEKAFKIRKRSGSKRAYLVRGCAVMFRRGVEMSGELTLSVEVLGRTEDKGGRVYTIGPNYWSKHYSPLIGKLTGTKGPENEENRGVEKFNFQANQIQLSGPVPDEMYHRYVEFKPFVERMFLRTGLRGRILNRALHYQHARIYNYDRMTEYGCIPEPSRDLTLKFLEMVHFDQGGRIFTYVLTLDGLLRFTETGKEFGIDLLSKHTMHSAVAAYIAWSGEFFVRRLEKPGKDPKSPGQKTHPPDEVEGGPPVKEPPKDPAHYELVIDNDSGTYRPKKSLLPLLTSFLTRNFPDLRILSLPCDDPELSKMKEEQRELKKAEGDRRTFIAYDGSSSGSISSSDIEELDIRAAGADSGAAREGPLERGLRVLAEPGDAAKEWVAEHRGRKSRDGSQGP